MEQFSKRIRKIYNCSEECKEAILFFYESESIEDIEKRILDEQYAKNRKKGEIGENVVNYSLKWLPSEYKKIEPVANGKYGYKSIRILNKDFINESQEIDHIVVGPQGIFLIETKNYSGKVIVDKHGNWVRIKSDGVLEGERNPNEQVRRHEKIIASIVGDVEIISIICLSHPKVIIEGCENSSVKVIKSDLLCDYIENYKGKRTYSDAEINQIIDQIRKFQL